MSIKRNPQSAAQPQPEAADSSFAEAKPAADSPVEPADKAADAAADCTPDALSAEEQCQQLAAELTAAEKAAEQAEAQLLRLRADFDNYRRRQREESERLSAQAGADIITSLLPVLDNFEHALAAIASEQDRVGVEMIAKQLFAALHNAGLEELEALGKDFDPNFHQAVTQQEGAAEDKNKVLAVLQTGYLYHGRLLRPAMVQVGV